MNNLNDNPMKYITNENHPLEFDNKWYASGMIFDTGNPTEDVRHAFFNYKGPNKASTGGIREQIPANADYLPPFNYNDIIISLQGLSYKYGEKEYQWPPMSGKHIQMFNEVVEKEIEKLLPNNDEELERTVKKINNKPDRSIIIDEETGDKYKWIDGKLVKLDEQNSTN